ncbi:NADH-quinone oxidoreductase subunit J family protein [Bowmanella dokdonensis]|uniref:NADH-quinone oxidoreductase subunit J n=1 Tax=Bowmanella dokdonensis TaxID=751969 RepID=A0A939DKA2_9ALTE|nr:NADH-quinone oxidoreductase subunit J [Bowmanella dokdonensis]MBN7824283.1 NADH-quinone oxidoreductase subunit J [Bowmanella dokdonensis]
MVGIWTDITFYLCAAIAVFSGWRVFRTDSMVRASFLLLISFLAVGVIMLLLAAVYLGTALFFMMAVEMMVMALFMVMFMMNPAGLNPMNMVHQPWVAALLGFAVFTGLSLVAVYGEFPANPAPADLDPVRSLGRELLGDSMLVFESAGIALLATMIGTVVLSSHRGRYGPANEGSEPPGLDPGGPPAKSAAQKQQQREEQKEQEEDKQDHDQ